MADIKIKKVIKGLEHCADRRFCNDACPYSDIIRDQNRGMDECVSALAKDALELMKEQKPKRAYTVVQIRGAFAEAVNDMVKSPLADSVYFHLMGKIEEHLS